MKKKIGLKVIIVAAIAGAGYFAYTKFLKPIIAKNKPKIGTKNNEGEIDNSGGGENPPVIQNDTNDGFKMYEVVTKQANSTVNLRDKPSSTGDSKIIGKVKSGDKIQATPSATNGWHEVRPTMTAEMAALAKYKPSFISSAYLKEQSENFFGGLK